MGNTAPTYSGMTVNERLFAAGLIDRWDSAIRARDRRAALKILAEVGFSDSQAEETTDTILASPTMYGFPAAQK
jgi:hypothetical protein